jgi:hypothetical protein
MGRTGRKRKGRCILLLTESEEKKFNNAKETYTRVQQLIANGSSIRYHPTIPSVIPKNYKPTMARQKLTIGDYVAIVKTKRGPKVAEQDYTTDGKMKESTMNAFIKSFPVGLNTLDALVNHYWPIQSHKTKLNTTIPIQKNLQRSRVSHSKTTRYFTTCIRRMEHRILHPGQDVPVAKVLEQKKLVLPKRQKPLDDRQEPITKKQKKATLDDHYEHFMNHVQEDGMSFLFDQPGPSRPRRDSIDELIKDIQLDVQDGKGKKRADIVMDAKGKKKAVDDIDDLLMDMFDDDFETSFHDIKGKRRAVEPLLKQRKKTKTSDHSIHVDKSYVDKPASNNIENTPSNSAFEQRSWSSILPASPPAQDDKKSTLPEDDVLGGDDFGGDDFGDADPGDADPGGNADPGGDADPGDADFGDDYGSFGDTMFNDAALEQWDNMAAFNEDLAPIYPFDKPQVSSQVEIKCIFPQPATFSEKAIGLLKQRYPSLRKDTLLVKIIAQLMTDSPHDSDDYSFGDNMDFEEMLKEVDIHGIAKKSDPIVIQDSQPAMKEPREEMKPIKEIKPIKESKPTVKPMQDSPPIVPNMSEPFENHDEPDDEPDEDMFGSEIAFDLDDEVFINMIENKDTEGGGGAEEISFYLQSQYDKSFRKASQKKPTLDNQQTVNTEREALQLEDGTRESTQPLQDEGESTQPLQEKTSASTDPIKQEEDILIFSSFGDPLEKTVIIPEPNQQGLFLSEGPSQPHEDVPDTSSQSSAQNLDDLNSSLLVHTKKKKGRILLDEEDSTVILDSPERPVVGIYKRLKELSRMVDSQEDDFEPRVKESRYQSGPSRVPNPYFEMEAERSEDDISADEEEEGNEEELDDSFINDEESFMTQQQALRHQEVSPVRWMRGFHAEKWLQPQEDDTIIDDEEDEEEISGSSILPTVIDQDDDFM